MWRHWFFSHVSLFQILRYPGGFSSFLYVFRSFNSFNFALFRQLASPTRSISLSTAFRVVQYPSLSYYEEFAPQKASVWLSLLENNPIFLNQASRKCTGEGTQSDSAGTEQMPDLASDRIACVQQSTTTVEKLRTELCSLPQAIISSFDNHSPLGSKAIAMVATFCNLIVQLIFATSSSS